MFNDTQQPGQDGAGAQMRVDRGTILTGFLLLLVTVIAWISVVRQAGNMQGMGMPSGSMTGSGQSAAMQAPAMTGANSSMPANSQSTGAQAPAMTGADNSMPANGQSGGMQAAPMNSADKSMPAGSQSAGMQAAPTSGTNSSMPAGSGLPWGQAAVAYLVAWAVMMAAMMLPSAAPMIVLYNGMYQGRAPGGRKAVSTALFALVYVAVWAAFGIPVYVASLLVAGLAGRVPAVGAYLPYAVAAVLLAAGLFQFTPLKRACLRVCQHPFVFMMGHWRSGYTGALRMAADHAAYCVGCCWALMVVLVAAGAMSLPWVLVISIVVFAEKLLPRGAWAARATGGALILLALLVAIQPGLAEILRGMPAQ